MTRSNWINLSLLLGVPTAMIGCVYVLMNWNPDCKRFETQVVETLNNTRFRHNSPDPTTKHYLKVCAER